MFHQQLDDRCDVFLLILAQSMPPFSEFVGVFDVPAHDSIYSFYGIFSSIIPSGEYTNNRLFHKRFKNTPRSRITARLEAGSDRAVPWPDVSESRSWSAARSTIPTVVRGTSATIRGVAKRRPLARRIALP